MVNISGSLSLAQGSRTVICGLGHKEIFNRRVSNLIGCKASNEKLGKTFRQIFSFQLTYSMATFVIQCKATSILKFA